MMAMLWAQKIMYAETKEEAIALYKRVPRLLKDKVEQILIESGCEDLIKESEEQKGGADMGEVKEPYEGGTGSLLEVVDMMCDVTEKLADIVRKQAVLIEQERIAGAVFPADLSEERKQAEDDLDRIEMKLRRI